MSISARLVVAVGLLVVAGVARSPVHAGTWYVNASLTTGADDGRSWSGAFRGRLGLQRALGSAQAGDEVWVAAGVYAPAPPSGARAATFRVLSGVRVLGGFRGDEGAADLRDPAAHPTILTGDLNSDGNETFPPPENSIHVVTIVDGDASTLLDGVSVRDGIADAPGDSTGGCLLIVGGAPTVRGCTFSDGQAFRGGGVGVTTAAPLFEDCTFTRSVASAGANFFQTLGSSATLRRCRFVGQSNISGGSAGVGIFSGHILGPADNSVLTVDDCDFSIVEREFTCPAGTAIAVRGGRAEITDCRFIRNEGCGDGAVHAEAEVEIDRCVFIGNEGRFDGGAAIATFSGTLSVSNSLFLANDREGFSTFNLSGSSTFTNCTIVGNGNTSAFHSAFVLFDGPHNVRNCIVWGNTTGLGNDPVFQGNAGGVGLRFDRCLVQGWAGQWPGEHSFAGAPGFVDPLGADGIAGTTDDDLRPGAGSPVIDRGNNGFVGAGVLVDLGGVPRFRDDPATPDMGEGAAPVVDLGAFEFQPTCAGDFSGDGVVDSRDFFGFVAAFFAAAPGADFNHDTVVNSADFFDFLAAFFVPCPR